MFRNLIFCALALGLFAGPASAAAPNPVVILHGWGGDIKPWQDFIGLFAKTGYTKDNDIICFQYYKKSDDSSGPAKGLTALNFRTWIGAADLDVPIEDISAAVAKNTRIWLRRRAGLADDDASKDATLPAPDWICHSMGGLVFRGILSDHPELVRRCVDLSTPHFGVAIGESAVVTTFSGYETEQMAYGSSFLWDLAEKWFYRKIRPKDMLFVVGVGRSKDGTYDDGLVKAYSATLQTTADAEFDSRTYYVNRMHTKKLSPGSRVETEPDPNTTEDVVYRLAFGFLNDTGYFAGGRHPTQREVLIDDGLSDDDADKVLANVRGTGALFAQVMSARPLAAGETPVPVSYAKKDKIASRLVSGTVSFSDFERSHGNNDEGSANGLVLVHGGNMPVGRWTVRFDGGTDNGTAFGEYDETVAVAGGGGTVWRTRPGAKPATSRATVTDKAGVSRELTVPNAWLVEHALAGHAENLSACASAASGTAANGYPVALSCLLGLPPEDPDAAVRIGGIALSGTTVTLKLTAGNKELSPADAPFVLQGKANLGDRAWTDLPRSGAGWQVSAPGYGFFRAAFRW